MSGYEAATMADQGWRQRVRPIVPAAIVATWLAVIVGGFAALGSHSMTAGEQLQPPSTWPTKTGIARSADGYQLLMFVHPDCPCTRASLGELEKLLARHPEKLHAHIVAYRRDGIGAGIHTPAPLLAGATTLPTTWDERGAEAACFRAATSGQVLLYDAEGTLRFDGGITVARGHAGDSDGGDAIEAVLRGETPAVRQTPVYGCSIARSRDTKPAQP